MARDRSAAGAPTTEPASDLLRELEPVLDELCAWVNTDYIGCVDVQERGEKALRKVRDWLARAEAGT